MYHIDMANSKVQIKNITVNELPVILKWYNNSLEFKYATGIDKPVSYKFLYLKLIETAISSEDFFAGIFLNNGSCKIVGIIKGCFKEKNKLWINSIVLEPEYRNMGYGTEAIKLLFARLKNIKGICHAYLSVMEENKRGIDFWKKNGFTVFRKYKKSFNFEGSRVGAVIMHRSI